MSSERSFTQGRGEEDDADRFCKEHDVNYEKCDAGAFNNIIGTSCGGKCNCMWGADIRLCNCLTMVGSSGKYKKEICCFEKLGVLYGGTRLWFSWCA